MDTIFDFDAFDELMLDNGWGPQDLWKVAIRKGKEISVSSIRGWIARRGSPKLPNIRMLADVFEVDVRDLLVSEAAMKGAPKAPPSPYVT